MLCFRYTLLSPYIYALQAGRDKSLIMHELYYLRLYYLFIAFLVLFLFLLVI